MLYGHVFQKSANECFRLLAAFIASGKKKKQEKKQNYFGDFGIANHSETLILDLFQKLIFKNLNSFHELIHAYLVPSSSAFMFWYIYLSNIF